MKKLLIASAFLVFFTASVSAVSAIVLNASSGNVGDTVLVNGTGYTNGANYIYLVFGTTRVDLTGVAGTLTNGNGTVNASATGTWNATFVVPLKAGNPYTLTASNGTSQDNATATYNVVEKLNLNQTSGNVGNIIIVSGTGFNTSAVSVTSLKFAGTTVNSSTTAISADGTFGTNFTFAVPNASKGSKTVSVLTDANSTGGGNAAIQTTFAVNPKVVQASPSSGNVGDTTAVTVTGFNASIAHQVWFGGAQAVVNSGGTTDSNGYALINITVPNISGGLNNVKVNSTADTSGANSSAYTVVPAITAISAASGVVGSSLQINGSGFNASKPINVTIGGVLANITAGVASDASGNVSVTVTVPALTGGPKNIKVNTSDGASANNTNFNVTPQITQITPTGNVSDSISINGTGFANETLFVFIDGVSAAVVGTTSTADAAGNAVINATVPHLTRGTKSVKVNTTSDATGNTNASGFTVLPKVVSASPSSGSVNDTTLVTVTGYSSTEYLYVLFDSTSATNNTAAVVNSSGDAVINVTVPYVNRSLKSIKVNGTANATGATKSGAYTVLPKVFSVTPSAGFPGNTTLIVGYGFDSNGALNVTFNNTFATINSGFNSTADGNVTVNVTVPLNISRGLKVLRVNSTNDATGNTSTYNVSAYISTVVPSPVHVGDTILITGYGFNASDSINVTISGTLVTGINSGATIPANGTLSANVTVPNVSGGAQNVSVNTSADPAGASLTNAFTVSSGITAVGPTAGNVGSNVTINGTGFVTGTVIYAWFGSINASAVYGGVNSSGFLSINATVPNLANATYNVKVNSTADQTGNTSSNAFSVTPKITLNATSGNVGNSIGISGTGFPSGAGVVNPKFAGSAVSTTPPQATVAADGTWNSSLVFTVPAIQRGAKEVRVTEDATFVNVNTTFVVNPKVVSLSSNSGTVGGYVNITLSGFTNQTLSVLFNNSANSVYAANNTALFPNASGDLVVNVTVPYLSKGTYDLVVNGSTAANNATGSGAFAINPVITAINTTNATVGGYLQINGTGFASSDTLQVRFGNALATINQGSTSSVDGNVSINVTVPNVQGGTQTIRVNSTTDSTGNTTIAFTVVPKVTSISPAIGAPTSTALVVVSGFISEAVSVRFNATAYATINSGSVNSSGDARLNVTVPFVANGTYNIIVNGTTANNNATLANGYSVMPRISSSNSTNGTVGDLLLIAGYGFATGDNTLQVWFGSTQATLVSGNLSTADGNVTIVAIVPNITRGNKTVTVNSTNDTTGNTTSFFVNPRITALNQSSGIVGNPIVINGTGFSNETLYVYIGGTLAAITAGGNGNATGWVSVAVTVPNASRGSKSVLVNSTTDATGATSGTNFTVNPKITAITPSSGNVGNWTVISGTGFSNETLYVYFGSTAASINSGGNGNVNGIVSINVTVPSVGSGVQTVKVNSTSDSAGNTSNYTVSPVITSLSATSGFVGSVITITGAGFNATDTVTVYWDGTATGTTNTSNSAGGATVAFTVPSAAGIAHSVSLKDTSSYTANVTLTVNASISLNASSGRRNTLVNVTGTGFGASEANIYPTLGGHFVVIDRSSSNSGSSAVTANATGSFWMVFIVPAAEWVTDNGVYAAGTQSTSNPSGVNFTVLTSNDTTAPSSVTGLSSSVTAISVDTYRVALSWTAATDNVGVSYYKVYRNGTLIGTSSGTGTTYTETVSPGTYGYIVGAFDAAGNAGTNSSALAVTAGNFNYTTGFLQANTWASALLPPGDTANVGLRSYTSLGGNYSINNVLASLNGNYTTVYYKPNDSASWLVYNANVGLSGSSLQNATYDNRFQYWIYMNATDRIEIQ